MRRTALSIVALLALGMRLNAQAPQAAPAQPAVPQPASPARPSAPRRPATTATKQAPAGPASMTNQDVLRLVAVGLPEDAIISVIRQAPRRSFTVTSAGIAALKRGKATDAIIEAMQAPAADTKLAGAAAAPPPPKPAPPPPPVTVALKKGSTVNLQLKNLLSSETARAGSALELEVADDVLVDGRVMIKKGSLAVGRVTQAVARRRSNPGKLEFNIDSVKGSNGTDIRLLGTQGAEGVRGADVSFPAASKFIAVTDEDFVMQLPQ